MSWIPVDDAASVVTDVTFAPGNVPTVQHLENPTRQPWTDMLKSFGRHLGVPKPPVPFDEWLGQVAGPDSDEELYPVKKLYTFFKNSFQTVACGQIVLSTDVAQAHSTTLRDMGAVTDETVDGYVKYWKNIGYLKK